MSACALRAPAVSETDVASFRTVRPRLFGIAYQVLGSANDADDVVQDAWIRWQDTDRTKVRDSAAFLATTTTRLAINVTQSARARRETQAGPSLPEPAGAEADPALATEQREALELALQRLWGNLSPAERAAYVLREAFDYPYRQIARVLAVSEVNARQLAVRGRRRLSGEIRLPVAAPEQRALLDAFVAAAQTGDLTALEQLLSTDVNARPTHTRKGLSCRPRSFSSTARSPSRRAGTASFSTCSTRVSA